MNADFVPVNSHPVRLMIEFSVVPGISTNPLMPQTPPSPSMPHSIRALAELQLGTLAAQRARL